MSQLSLNGTLRTCKVDQGWASRIQSDRFENPDLMVCPVWTGFDNTNRAVCMDSYYTKSPGCNSPLDRVDVENALRPKYMEYINLDAEGFRFNQDLYNSASPDGTGQSCKDADTNMDCYQSGIRRINLDELNVISGNFGLAPNGAQVYPRCESYPINRAMRQEQQAARTSASRPTSVPKAA